MEEWEVREIIDRDPEYRRMVEDYRRYETICVLAMIAVCVIGGIALRSLLTIFGIIGLGICYFVVSVRFMPKIDRRIKEIVEEFLKSKGVIKA